MAILFNNTFEYEIHKVKSDHAVKSLKIDISIEGERIILVIK